MKRMLRVNELIKRELGDIFERQICPELDCLVTITGVNTSPDLHNATIYVSVYGADAESPKKVLRLLANRRVELQRALSAHVVLKYTPVLRFVLDDQLEKADRMFKILDDLEATGKNDDEQ